MSAIASSPERLPAPTGVRTSARSRVALSAAVGIAAVGLAAFAYTQLGRLGVGFAPALALAIASVPAFLAGGALLAALGVLRPVRGAYPLSLLAPTVAFYAAFFLIPLGILLVTSVATKSGFSTITYGFDLSNFRDAVSAESLRPFVRTVRFAAIGTALTIAVGLPFTYWLARYAPPRRRGLLLALVVIPFWTSFLIRTYSFIILLDPNFPLSKALSSVGLVGDDGLHVLYTSTAVQLGIVYNYLPLFILPVYATLERMDWRLVDAALDLGASRLAAFRQITLRLAAPGMLTGGLLVFIPMMGEYVIPQVLGGNKVNLIGNVIQNYFLASSDYPLGAALAVLLIAVLSVFLVLYLWLSMRSEESYGA